MAAAWKQTTGGSLLASRQACANGCGFAAGGFAVLIQDLGWNAYFEAAWNEEERTGCVPARVVTQQRGLWRVAGDFGERWARASGKLRKESEEGSDWPAVGDWVAAEICIGKETAVIQTVVRRRSKFSRKQAGKKIAEQVIAANVDKAVVVAGLDGDFNPRRLERYLAQCWDSGARPMLVLNKADACAELEQDVATAENVAMGAPVFALSAKTGKGLAAFEASLVAGETIVFLGSSGVGKSSLINQLLGRELQATQPVRESDSRGRHTTTSRELFALPNGTMVIDTPGLRELQLWDAADGLAQAFTDIDELATHCRFADCTHEGEPGCAVRAALERGELDARRFENRRKLEREEEFLLRKMDPQKQQEYRKRIKILFREIRQNLRAKNKNKE
jgi:ribosome biogenesis GTPase / thiamine phosphate phosphatase